MHFLRSARSSSSPFTAVAAIGAVSLAFAGLTYAHAVEPDWIEVRPIRLPLPRLDEAFSGYRLVQISDIHMDKWMNRRRLEEIVSRVNRLKPDLTVITGDFVTFRPGNYAKDMVYALRKLEARDGVAAVLGNHDHGRNLLGVRQILKAAGVMELSNSVHTLRRGEAALHLAGIDDALTGNPRLDLVLQLLPPAGAAILLAHEPDFAAHSAPTGRFDLQLSGHSHGGQIRLPAIGPLFLPRQARKYPSGQYRVGNMIQYTNRGLGMVHLHLRFHCRPEITIFTLLTPQDVAPGHTQSSVSP